MDISRFCRRPIRGQNLAMGRLSEDFQVREFRATATRFDNIIPQSVVPNIRQGVERVLQPWRDVVGRLHIASGYRSPDVNRAVGGSRTSAHLRGLAADVVPVDTGYMAAFLALAEIARVWRLPVAQILIYESQSHIHVSWRAEDESQQLRLTPPRLTVKKANGAYVGWASYLSLNNPED